MPERDDPVARGGREIVAQPVRLRAVGGAVGAKRVEANEMHTSKVKGVVSFAAGGESARLCVGGQVKDIVVRVCIRFVVAAR